MNRFIAIAVGALALASWFSPNHYLPWPSFHAQMLMAIAIALAGFSMLRSTQDSTHWRVPIAALFILGTAAIPLAQYLAGLLVFSGDVWVIVVMALGTSLSMAMGARCVQTLPGGLSATLRCASIVILVGAVAATWVALYQWQWLDYLGLYVEPMPPDGRAFANFSQANHLAALLALGLVAVVHLHAEQRFGGAVALLLAVFLGVGLAMTQSRMGQLAVLVIVAWLLYQRCRIAAALAPRRLLIGYAAVLVGIAVWVAISPLGPGETHAGRGVAEIASKGTRWIHWQTMLDAIGRKPWQGYGWNQVSVAQLAVAIDHPPSREILKNSHNLALDMLVWNGIPLGAFLIVALMGWLLLAMRRAGDTASSLAVGAVLVFVVHCGVEYPYEYAYFVLPIGFIAGALCATTMTRAVVAVHRRLMLAALVVACALTAWMSYEYLVLEEEMRDLRFEEARIGLDKPKPNVEPPHIFLLTQLDEFLGFARKVERADMSAAELERMGQIASRNPHSYSLIRYAAALAVNGRPREASEVLAPICKTHPASACSEARARWKGMAARDSRIAAAPWLE